MITNKLIRWLTTVYDPLVPVRIGTQRIRAPLSHALRDILQVYPQYGFNLTRLVAYTYSKYPELAIIDIGANIGDTAAYINNFRDLATLCIEGDPAYFGLLETNVRAFPATRCCLALVGASDQVMGKQLIREKGTAHLQDTANQVPFRSLDTILEGYPEFNTGKFLKIDTDGYDISVLKGSSEFLIRQQPVLFFEFDPGLIRQQLEDPVGIFGLLQSWGYEYMLVYQNNGDYLLSLHLSSAGDILFDLANYYMGRETQLYADVCLFSGRDRLLFEEAREKELAWFSRFRKFHLNR
jgi:FkbM family methyltransferase